MDDEKFEEIEIPNPDGHYFGAPKTIKVFSIQISDQERIEKVQMPQGGDRFSHRILNKAGQWKPCPRCGDLVGIPGGGPLPAVDNIRRTCSMYGKY
jgi:hypothetical protein